MTSGAVYLDHNATAPVCNSARQAVAEALQITGNPSSVHRQGARARQVVDMAREQILGLLGNPEAEVVFTSGGTEANNLALLGSGLPVFASAIEHPSVIEAVRSDGEGPIMIPVDRTGIVALDELDRLLAGVTDRFLVSIMLANNETGVIQPVSEAARLVHDRGGLLHCDAVQGPGKVTVDMDALGADLLTLSAHKFGGPMGVGALVIRKGVEIRAMNLGGGQEGYRRAGTHNLPGIAGFGAAARTIAQSGPFDQGIRDYLEVQCVARGASVIGAQAPRLPNTACLTMPTVSSETQVMALDLEGIAVSAGSACSSGKVGPSHVLAAMGIPPDVASTAIRVSMGTSTQRDEIDRFIAAWTTIYERAHTPARARMAS